MVAKLIIVHDHERIARYRPVRAAVRPRACLAECPTGATYAGPCWVNDGPPACRNCACIACHDHPSLRGNEARHASLLAQEVASGG